MLEFIPEILMQLNITDNRYERICRKPEMGQQDEGSASLPIPFYFLGL